ncbi:7110_t:CDS:2, partial [Racocetra persica]
DQSSNAIEKNQENETQGLDSSVQDDSNIENLKKQSMNNSQLNTAEITIQENCMQNSSTDI